MTLEEQLEVLAEFGLTLNAGVTIDDLLYSLDRKEFESEPFDALLFVLGIEVEREPWDRAICDSVWNFDLECIEGDGSYVAIVNRACRVAGRPGLLSHVTDHVDLSTGKASLSYTVGGLQRDLTVSIDADWADPETVARVFSDIEAEVGQGRRFYAKDNGQASVLFFLTDSAAADLNVRCNASLARYVV